jgi:hypothetical protein
MKASFYYVNSKREKVTGYFPEFIIFQSYNICFRAGADLGQVAYDLNQFFLNRFKRQLCGLTV